MSCVSKLCHPRESLPAGRQAVVQTDRSGLFSKINLRKEAHAVSSKEIY